MTAGARFAAAVPDVHVTATGRPLSFAAPTAKKPAQRSSMCEKQRSRGSRTSARTSGEEREPGDVQASRMPQRASSSANARSSRWVSGRAGMMAGVPEPLLLLHGFTQTGRGWDEVVRHLDGERYRALAPDIRGHGAAATRRPIDFAACVQDAVGLMRAPVHARGLLAGRPAGAARRARAPRARHAARARLRHGGDRGRRPSARGGATPTARWRPGWRPTGGS